MKLWAQIASRFKLKSERLIFESLNEPPGSTQEHANRYNDINQRFVNLVRASGGNNADRLLTLPGLNTNIQQTVDWFVEPTNAEPWILHVHDYDPWDFVSTSWGRTFWGSADDKTALEAPFKALQGRWSTRPTMIGEWGLTGTTVEGAASWKYFDFVARTAVAYKSAALLWDNGADHFNRATGLWRDPVKLAIMTAAVKGIKNSLPAEGQTEALYFKVGQTAAATNIALELNGNTITKVAGTKRTLVLGTDYTISTTGILLSASYLTSILTTSTGLRDTVTITFSAGVTLPFRILTYTAATVPVSSYTVSGTGSALSIPFSAPGSTLATVKAVKSDGTPLKDDWTQWLGTLQQARISWGGDFSLDSQGTSVVLSTSLLGEIKTAGLTTLTLEFWPRVGTGNSVLVNVLVN